MLGISIYKNKANFIRTSKLSNNDLCVTHHGSYKYSDLNRTITSFLKDIIKNEDITNENSISLIFDTQFCLFNQIFCDDIESLDFHGSISGFSDIENLDSYYYPMGVRDDRYLGVHIDNKLKQKMVDSVDKLGFNIDGISLGIFSAEKLASTVFKAKSLSKYVIVRFITSSSLEVIFINDGLFSLYGRFNIVKNKINLIKVFGDKSSIDDVVLTLEQIVKGRKSLSNIDKAFMSQPIGQSKLIKNLVNKKYNDIVLLDLFNHKNHKSLNSNVGKTISRSSFCELGIMFGDLNV